MMILTDNTRDHILAESVIKTWETTSWQRLFNKPGVAGAVLQTSLWFNAHPFPPNLQDTFTPDPYELKSLSFYITSPHIIIAIIVIIIIIIVVYFGHFPKSTINCESNFQIKSYKKTILIFFLWSDSNNISHLLGGQSQTVKHQNLVKFYF